MKRLECKTMEGLEQAEPQQGQDSPGGAEDGRAADGRPGLEAGPVEEPAYGPVAQDSPRAEQRLSPPPCGGLVEYRMAEQ